MCWVVQRLCCFACIFFLPASTPWDALHCVGMPCTCAVADLSPPGTQSALRVCTWNMAP